MIDGMARFDKWELLQVIVLPKVAAEPQATNATLPVAFLFAVLTVVTCLQAQGVPFLASGVTGDTSLITAASVQAAVPGTIATIAILGALLHVVWNGLLEQPATRPKAAWTDTVHTYNRIQSMAHVDVPLHHAAIQQHAVRAVSASWMHSCPQSCCTLAGAHEAGHYITARKYDAKMNPPFFIPAGLGILGSFGTITGFRQNLQDRTALLRITEAGPAAGAAVAGALTLVGLGLSVYDIGPQFVVRSEHVGQNL